MQEERDRASQLEQDLAAARRDATVQAARAAKAGDEAGQLRKTPDAGTADLRKTLQQQSERASTQLEQELAAARSEVATRTALAAKVADEASQLRKTADAGTADLRKSLQQRVRSGEPIGAGSRRGAPRGRDADGTRDQDR